MLSRHLVLVPCPPSFRDPAFPLAASAHAIRPGVLERADRVRDPPAWLDELGDRPVVYPTLGTIFNVESGRPVPPRPQRVGRPTGRRDRRPSAASSTRPGWGRAVRTCASSGSSRRRRCCPVPIWSCRTADQAVWSAPSSFGLPSVLLPMGADQTHNADRCGQLGVAVVLDPVSAPPGRSVTWSNRCWADAAYRRRAARFAREAAQLPDAASAVGLLESLVS